LDGGGDKGGKSRRKGKQIQVKFLRRRDLRRGDEEGREGEVIACKGDEKDYLKQKLLMRSAGKRRKNRT